MKSQAWVCSAKDNIMVMTTAINVAITPLSEANTVFFQPRAHPHMITCIAKKFEENCKKYFFYGPLHEMRVWQASEFSQKIGKKID